MSTLTTSHFGMVLITITALLKGSSGKCRNVFIKEKFMTVPHRAQEEKKIGEFVAILAKERNKLKISEFYFVFFRILSFLINVKKTVELHYSGKKINCDFLIFSMDFCYITIFAHNAFFCSR